MLIYQYRTIRPFTDIAWWRHQMETISALLATCAGNSPVPGEFPAQRPVTQSFGVIFDLRLNTRLSKQPWGWWFETLSRPLWRHCNGKIEFPISGNIIFILLKWISNHVRIPQSVILERSSWPFNRIAWQWAETLVEIRGTLADIRGTTKLGCRWNFPKHEFNKPVCLEVHHYLLAHLSQ